jgi:hypothetical protein
VIKSPLVVTGLRALKPAVFVLCPVPPLVIGTTADKFAGAILVKAEPSTAGSFAEESN